MTAEEYAKNLETNLQALLGRAKSGVTSEHQPCGVCILKGDGKKLRPIGIPTFEDKVLQRAVAMALEAVYEQDLLDCSYGFRPERSTHSSAPKLWHATMDALGGWVYEAEIEDLFGSVDHRNFAKC